MLFNKLEDVGYGEFKTDNPKQTIYSLTRYLQPPALKSEIQNRSKYAPQLEMGVKRYIRLLSFNEKECQDHGKPEKSTVTHKEACTTGAKENKGTKDGALKHEVTREKKEPI